MGDLPPRIETGSVGSTSSPRYGDALRRVDPEIFDAIAAEEKRQRENIELIASENFTSRAVMEAQGSVLTNKYAEGYPRKRWYGGCENVDVAEQLAIDRAKRLFGAEHVNVQPHSGAQANMAVYFAAIKPGDKILTMNLAHGGHLTHGHPANFSGKFYQVTHYGVDEKTEQIDYDALQKQAEEVRPVMITAGASAYPRTIDFPRLRQIADSVGAILFIDMAHIAGLVAGGQHPSPIPHAQFVTTTTHKSLRGPRGGIVLCEEKFAKQIDSTLFPGVQGGPLMHVIAAKAVCFHEALQPQFREYQRQVVINAKALAAGLAKHGYRIVSGGTDNHLMLVDLRPKEINGKEAQEVLDRAGITVNKNAIPFDTYPIFKPGGIRVGTPAVTTRGMKEEEMLEIADLIAEALEQSHRRRRAGESPPESARFNEKISAAVDVVALFERRIRSSNGHRPPLQKIRSTDHKNCVVCFAHESSSRSTRTESITRRFVPARRAAAVQYCDFRRDRRSHPTQTNPSALQPCCRWRSAARRGNRRVRAKREK